MGLIHFSIQLFPLFAYEKKVPISKTGEPPSLIKMLNRKLSAIRWSLGDEWDMLDT